MSQASPDAHPLLTLIGLGQQARQAGSLDELLFAMVVLGDDRDLDCALGAQRHGARSPQS